MLFCSMRYVPRDFPINFVKNDRDNLLIKFQIVKYTEICTVSRYFII